MRQHFLEYYNSIGGGSYQSGTWVLPGASADRNFTNGETFGPGTDAISRSTAGNNLDSSGNYYQVAANTLAVTDLGVASQIGTRTNLVFNPRGEGGAVGRLPDNWTSAASTGITIAPQGPITVLNAQGQGVQGNYFLISGTSTVLSTCLISPTGRQEVAGTNGQFLPLSAYLAVLPPSMFGDSTPATSILTLRDFKIGARICNSSGTVIASSTVMTSSYVPDATARRYDYPGGFPVTNTGGTAAFIELNAARFTPLVGIPVYFYLFVGGGMVEANGTAAKPALLIQNPAFVPNANQAPNPNFSATSTPSDPPPTPPTFPNGMTGATFTGITQTPEAYPIVNVPGVGNMQCMDIHLSGTFTASPTTGFTFLGPAASTIALTQNQVVLQTPYIAVLGTGTGMAGLNSIRVSGREIKSDNTTLVSLTNGPLAIISTTLTQQRYQYVAVNASCAKFQPALAYLGQANATVDCHVRIGLWFINTQNSVTSTSTARNTDVLTYTAPSSFVGSSFAAMVELAPGEFQSAYTLLQVQDAGGTNSVSIEYTALDTVSLRVQRSGVYDTDVPLGPTGATFTFGLTADAITTVNITAGGSGYPASGSLFIQAGAGSGASVTYTSTAGVIDHVTIVSGGAGYTTATGLAPIAKVPLDIRRLVAGVPARAALTADASHIRACINNLPVISVAAASPFSGDATLVMGPSGQQIRRRAVAFASISANALSGWATLPRQAVHMCFGSGQSNGLQSHGVVDNTLNSTSFYIAGSYAAPAPGIPRELMAWVPADTLDTGGVKLPDIRNGGNQNAGGGVSGTVPTAEDQVGNPQGLTAMVGRQFSTSATAVGASETILRDRAARYGSDDYVAYYCGNIGGAGAASLIQIPSSVFTNGVWPFNNLKSNAVNMYSQARMQGWTAIPELVYYNGNTSGVVDVPTQVALMEQFRTDFTTFLAAQFPGTAAPLFIADLYSFENAQRDCVLSNVALPSPWIISGATYFNMWLAGTSFFYGDNLHYDFAGSSHVGDMADRASWTVQNGQSWGRCRVLSASRVGAIVTALIEVPAPPLVRDIINVSAPTLPSADDGIQIVKDSDGTILTATAPYTISSISATRALLTIPLLADPGSIATRLQVALYGYTTAGPPTNPSYVAAEQARTVYRDSGTATFTYDGLPDYKWLEPIDLLIPA